MFFSQMARRILPWVSTVALATVLAACGGAKPEALLASARDYLGKNDAKAAIIQIKNALQENADLPEGRKLLGEALLLTGDPVGAETELRKALALKHPSDQVVPLLARAMGAQRQFKKVIDEFGATELGTPAAKASLKTTLAVAHAAQGKRADSEAALAAALAADPEYTPALMLRARSIAAQDPAAAMAQVDAILAKKPNEAEAWKLKADLTLLTTKDSDKSVEVYRKALSIRPDYVESHGAILAILLRQGKLDDASRQLEELRKAAPRSFVTLFYETMLAFQKGDKKLAREKGQQLVRVGSNSPLVLQLVGAIELDGNSLVQADAFLSKSLQLAPGSVLTRRLLASTQLRAGQTAKAVATVTPLLKSDSLDAATAAVVGEVFLQSGDAKRAEEFFAKASKLDPANEKTRTALALTHLAGGRDEQGLAELQQISVGEKGTTATMALISAYLRRGEFDNALKAIDALEKKQPGRPMAANLRGRTLLAKKDPAGARKAFERSLEIEPTYFASVASLAAMDMADKKPDEARKRFESLLAKDPKNGPALLAIAELRARAGGTKDEVVQQLGKAVEANPTEPRPRLLLIDFLLQHKDSKQAVSVAQTAVSALPDSAELMDALGRAQQAAGDMNQALTAFNKVAAMQPLSPAPQMRLAEAHMAAKDKSAAAQALRKALSIKPDLVAAQRGLIMLAVDNKSYDEGVRIARGMQKDNPKDPLGYQFEGEIALAQKNHEAAAAAFGNGLKQTKSPGLAVRLHAAMMASGKSADAQKFAANWLKDNPKDLVFRMYEGDRAVRRDDFAEAEKVYRGVLQLEPKNGVAMNNLAWAMGKVGREGAVQMAEAAVALAPRQPAFIDTLAMLLSERNDYAKAVEWQTKALVLAPDVPLFRLNMAKIHIKGGKKDLARKELETLGKLGDKFAGKDEVATLLKGL